MKEKALGETVADAREARRRDASRSSASDVVHQDLPRRARGHDGPRGRAHRRAPSSGPTGIMMVGLQGSGKTTTCAKLARYLEKEGKKPLLVAADMQRPAAVEQLKVLGEQHQRPGLQRRRRDAASRSARRRQRRGARSSAATSSSTTPPAASRSTSRSWRSSATSRRRPSPENIFLVVDAMIGQDAVKTARGFHERLGLTGVVLTKLDGDARGGAALSVKEVTGAPIRLRRHRRDAPTSSRSSAPTAWRAASSAWATSSA